MSGVEPHALDEWRSAIGRSETRRQLLEAESLRRYALAVGRDPDVERTAPSLAHWAFFLPNPQDDEMGEDGHPRRGGFLPEVTLPRRMFAAAEMTFAAPLILGGEAELVSTVADVTHKSGHSGDLVFVEVDRVLTQGGEVRVRERQTYVYRDAGGSTPPAEPGPGSIEGELWEPGPVNLFRFSAVTFNGHRIHYDLPYARDVEGYPALLVHGPFTAAKLAAYAGRDRALAGFSFRARAPLFLGQPIRLQKGDGEVRAVRCDGVTAMTAKMTYR